MKVVINICYGGFSISEEARVALGLESIYDGYDLERTDPRLIELVEADPARASGNCAHLFVAEIPDEATDWEITEYDGAEDIIYVLDGKIVHL